MFVITGRAFFLHMIAAIILLTTVSSSRAGQLILDNAAREAITCTVDGYTVESGARRRSSFTIRPGARVYVGPNTERATQTIRWAKCGKLEIGNLPVTAKSQNHTLFFNAQQTRVLSVSLYPYLPNVPSGNFDALVAYVVQSYQAQNPHVLLNAVMDENVDIYSFDDLPGYLGPTGYDVMELDMMYLGFLVNRKLINPQPSPSGVLSVAQRASSIDGVLYGVPSWLCMDFIYSADPAVQKITSPSGLRSFLAQTAPGQTSLVGDYVGKWRLPSIYVNAFAQTYGYANIQKSFSMPPDPTVMQNLGSLVNKCENGGKDPCINGAYHSDSDPITERVFASGGAYAGVGFSEKTFYVTLAGGPVSIYVAPVPWGKISQPLLSADSFVTNSATCRTGSPCARDAANFMALMTSLQMKNYIVMAQDQQPGTPWRTLLVPYEQFYGQPAIANNLLYQQYQRVFDHAQPFPNTWTATQQSGMAAHICAAFKAGYPDYSCKM